MANTTEDAEPASFRAAIDQFIDGRLEAKLAKLAVDDPKRVDLRAKYQRRTWLADAARRVGQIQAVTHIVKGIHPDAKGTNLYVSPQTMSHLAEVGSHVLGGSFQEDVAGNAAALDVYALLKLQTNGQSLLKALSLNRDDALEALSDDPEQALALRSALVGLIDQRGKKPCSHERAKQLYWLTGNDACCDAQYHLLAPLYATSLAQSVYITLQEHRFGPANKEARLARRDGKKHDGTYYHYPSLAVQKLGGSNQQNVSIMNARRGGTNYLLSSLPPTWKSRDFRLPAHASSVFDRLFPGRIEVRHTLRKFSTFLATNPTETMETRNRVDAFVARLIDEVTIMAGGFHSTLPGGWSLDEDYNDLAMPEKLWLDPLRAELLDQDNFAREWLWLDWPAAIGKRFAQWLNGRLESRFPVGDAEHRQWKKLLLVDEGQDGWAQQLHRLRQSLDGPNQPAAQATHDDPASREVQV